MALYVAISRWQWQLSPENGGDAALLQRKFGPFASAAAWPDRQMHAALAVRRVPVAGTAIDGRSPRQSPAPGLRLQIVKDQLRVETREFSAWLDQPSGRGEIGCRQLPDRDQAENLTPPVQNFLRLLVEFLGYRDHLLLHAAALIHEGKGIVCPGRSGAGKSTFAAQQQPDALLADEVALVRRERDGFFLLPAPFFHDRHPAGEIPQPAPVTALGFLAQAAEDAALPLSRGESATRLLDCLLHVLPDEPFRRQAASLALELAASAPAVELRFSLSGDRSLALLEQAVAGEPRP